MIQLLQANPVKTKPADDPKSSGYPADPNPLVDALSADTFTLHGKKTDSNEIIGVNAHLPVRGSLV